MADQKIVITGGPGTGKTAIINQLTEWEHRCYPEISRQLILEAREAGIEQLFLEDPLHFSEKLLSGRIQQYKQAQEDGATRIFLDRGIPDILAYMKFYGQECPNEFIDACVTHPYTTVFLLPPWAEIHTTDNERYESFEQTVEIHQQLYNLYNHLGYQCMLVPFGTIVERSEFILKHANL